MTARYSSSGSSSGYFGDRFRVAAVKLVLGCLLVLLGSSGDTLAADALPANRTLDWSWAGVRGGIPRRTNIYTTLNPGASASEIQNAINSCPANQVVFLNAGSYSLSAGLKVGRDGVTLRGATNSAGEPTTILNFVSGSGGWGLIDFSKAGYPANNWNAVLTRNVVSGLTQGSTSVTLDSAPTGLQVSQMLIFDQVEDGNLVVVSTSDEGGGNWGRNGRYYQQLVKVTAINGNTVTFEPPIYGTYWNSSQSPQAYWFGTGLSQITADSGVEDVKINRNQNGGGANNIHFGPAIGCWAKNVWSTRCSLGHVRTGWALFCEVRDCVFTLHDSVASATYDAYITFTSAFKLENNIMTVTPCAVGMMSVSGSVIAYNYTTNFPYSQASWLPECMMTHGGHVYFNLFEGNYTPSMWADFTHGNSSFNAYIRNRLPGWEPGKSGSTRTINLQENQDHITALGNMLGTAGFHTSYGSLWNIDADSAPTFIRRGNWNVVDNGVPGTESLGGDTIRNSYLYSTKPHWFGNCPWPPVDPARGVLPSITNIPAGYRYVFNRVVPTGPVNLPPTAIANASPLFGPAPLAVTFSSAGSVDPEGTPLTYDWNFGDGSTSTAANPSHTFANEGTFVVQLTVSDRTNSVTATNITIRVGNQAPVAVASGSPTTGISPLAVVFSSAGSSDFEGGPLTYSWTFGDGATSTQANPTHTYQAIGSYVARLIVSDGSKSATSGPVSISVIHPSSGLVAAYGFEEGGGTTVLDASGNNNTGTLVNGAAWTQTGRYGRALQFNGTSSYVNVPSSPSLNLTTGATLMAWVYPTAVTAQYRDIIYKVEDIYFLEGSTPNNTPRFSGTFASGNLNATAPLVANQWTHLAATFDGATMKLYVNGVLNASRDQTGQILTSSDPLGIGGNSRNGQHWAGNIDEVRIYNRALSANEILNNMNTPITGAVARPAAPTNLRIVGP